MSAFDDLDHMLSDALDNVFADKFSYAPMKAGRKDPDRQQLHDIPVVLERAGELEQGKARPGSGRETKFAGRLAYDALVLDVDSGHLPDGRPRPGDIFRSEDQKYYSVDQVHPDGTRWYMVVKEGR